jgi:lipopolysaccharide transport system ATP-binding protein
VGALIELSAGFHPDLTGRENVYLQGAVMGMKRVEIDRKFSDIVDFSEVGDFIETPVKRYSSGMNARLGFSIAAHLDPEVLVIDEVLAVGDLAFQQKAFDRIGEMVRCEIPVIVVSHQLERISSLCSHAILLDRGAVLCHGSPSDCIAAYVERQSFNPRFTGATCSLLVRSIHAKTQDPIVSGEPVSFVVECSISAERGSDSEEILVRVRSMETGQILFAIGNYGLDIELPRSGLFALTLELQMNVRPGLYLVETHVMDRTRGQRVAKGPYTSVQVSKGQLFDGTVQMNPHMKVFRREVAEDFDSLRTT